MAILKCKMCGGSLEVTEEMTVCECEYCGTRQTVPTLDDEKKIKLFERANKLRANCEFDKAAGVYENIVADYSEEAEGYWGLILCRYGIEYVDDPATGKKIPTCHRSSFDSIMDDEDFEMVMEKSDSVSRVVYRDEAKYIEDVRKGIIEVSGKEEPYDIFICYKETDENGDRTLDSVLAQDVYDALTQKGYRVFFSRISLEGKLGVEYEPYIFAALNSARIMLAFGTSYDYYNAVWVKNEWSRYLKLMAKDKTKHLIPCFKGVDAYDMPKEFARLQAQDMGKVGAMQDLIRGIEKILSLSKINVSNQNSKEEKVLLERGNIALEDGDWEKASSYFNRVLDANIKSADAYLGLALSELQFKSWGQLMEEYNFSQTKLHNNISFQKAIKYATGELKERFDTLDSDLKDRIDKILKEWEDEQQALIDEANKQIGSQGIVLVKESGSVFSFVEKQSAFRINEGYLSPYFATDLDWMRAVAENPYILLYDGLIDNIQIILPLLEQIVKENVPLVIFSSIGETNEVLTTLIVNMLRGTFRCNAVNIPTITKEINEVGGDMFCIGYGQSVDVANMDSEVLYDIAAYTGGRVISEKADPPLKEVSLDMLGRALEVISDRNSTIIVDGYGTVDAVQARRNTIEAEKRNDLSQKCQEYYNKRLKMFDYGAAIINVGGDDESTVSYRLKSLKEKINSEFRVSFDDSGIEDDWDVTSRKLMCLAEYHSDCCGAILGTESKVSESGVEVFETGAIIREGFVSPYMITDKKKMEVRFYNPYILVTSNKITSIESILSLLDEVVKTSSCLLIIAEEVVGEALRTINVNLKMGTFKVACINAPKFNNEVDKDYLEDLALETGTHCFSNQIGRELKDATLDDLGRAKQVLISKNTTVIVGGECLDYNEIYARGQALSALIQKTTVPDTKEHYEKRYRQLMAHSVIIHVGADCESLMDKKFECILPLINDRNERITVDNSSLKGMYLSEEQLQWVNEYQSSLTQKYKASKEFLLLREECKARAQLELSEMKRIKEEQQLLEKQRIEEEHRLIEKQKEEARQKIEEERRLIEKQKDEAEQRERIRREVNQELEKLRIKKVTLQKEQRGLKGLFTKKRRLEIDALLVEIEREEQRLIDISKGE